jgi:hypothetical protein
MRQVGCQSCVFAAYDTRPTTPQVASESNRESVGADNSATDGIAADSARNAQSASVGSAAEVQKLPKLFPSREMQQSTSVTPLTPPPRATIIARKE